MTPVKQEFTHKPEIGQQGDCQRAVIASLLDLPLQSVPHFLGESIDPDGSVNAAKYWDLLQDFLGKRGYAYLVTHRTVITGLYGLQNDIYHEIAGQSPRDPEVTHAVVGKNGQIFFDPHPDNQGLAGDPNEWQHSYIVKLNDGS